MREDSYLAYGRHVLVDISGATSEMLNDLDALEQSLRQAAVTEGVIVLGAIKHAFSPTGVTILLLLAESHVSLHTYPEQGKAFFDAFTCGTHFEPFNIFRLFAETSSFKTYRIIRCDRGTTVGDS
jgi:S-adenosylmethionine decarboxylase